MNLPEVSPDTPSIADLRAALDRLDAATAPAWGTMDAPQMLRHCSRFMPLHQGVLDVWDRADSAFVSAYRKHHDAGFDIEIEYLGAPAMEGRALVLIDPMLATGASLQAAYDALCETGVPASVHVLTAIASEEGLANAQKWLPEGTSFILGGVDPDLNEHGYIVPGLGDAGDLAFGPKTRS